MRKNTYNKISTTAAGKEIENVNDFIFFGGSQHQRRYRRRLTHARTAYNELRAMWNNSQIGRKTKIRLFNSNFISFLLYSYEAWKMTGDGQMLDTIIYKCLRRISKIYWPHRVHNETVRDGGDQCHHQKEKMEMDRHVLWQDKNTHVRTASTWTPGGGKRKGGR